MHIVGKFASTKPCQIASNFSDGTSEGLLYRMITCGLVRLWVGQSSFPGRFEQKKKNVTLSIVVCWRPMRGFFQKQIEGRRWNVTTWLSQSQGVAPQVWGGGGVCLTRLSSNKKGKEKTLKYAFWATFYVSQNLAENLSFCSLLTKVPVNYEMSGKMFACACKDLLLSILPSPYSWIILAKKKLNTRKWCVSLQWQNLAENLSLCCILWLFRFQSTLRCVHAENYSKTRYLALCFWIMLAQLEGWRRGNEVWGPFLFSVSLRSLFFSFVLYPYWEVENGLCAVLQRTRNFEVRRWKETKASLWRFGWSPSPWSNLQLVCEFMLLLPRLHFDALGEALPRDQAFNLFANSCFCYLESVQDCHRDHKIALRITEIWGAKITITSKVEERGLYALRHGIQNSMDAILANHPALTKCLDWVEKLFVRWRTGAGITSVGKWIPHCVRVWLCEWSVQSVACQCSSINTTLTRKDWVK